MQRTWTYHDLDDKRRLNICQKKTGWKLGRTMKKFKLDLADNPKVEVQVV